MTVCVIPKRLWRCRFQGRGGICPCLLTFHLNVPANVTQSYCRSYNGQISYEEFPCMHCTWNSFSFINLSTAHFHINTASWCQSPGCMKHYSRYKDADVMTKHFIFNIQAPVATLCPMTLETIKWGQLLWYSEPAHKYLLTQNNWFLSHRPSWSAEPSNDPAFSFFFSFRPTKERKGSPFVLRKSWLDSQFWLTLTADHCNTLPSIFHCLH